MLMFKAKTATCLASLTVLGWILSLNELPTAGAFSLAPSVSIHAMNKFSFESKLHQNSYTHGLTFRAPKYADSLRKSEIKSSRLVPLNSMEEAIMDDMDPSPSTLDSIKSVSKSALSTLSFVAMEFAFRQVLRSKNIAFPPALAGCASLFTFMTALYVIPCMRKLADYIYSLFEPGSTVLAKWLPVFFVPSLVTLPLAPMPGSSIEILKVLGVIIGGFYFTLFSTAFTVLGVKKIKGNGAARSSEQDLELTRQVIMSHISDGTTATGSSKPTKPFSDGFFYTISTSAIMSIVASIVASNKIQNTIITTPLHSAAMLLTTLSSFVFGTRLPKSFTKFFHPLLTCTGITWSVMKMIGMLTNTSFNQLLQSYKVGTLCPVHLGAGDVLLFMLGPAVISLACQMYNRKKLMRDNILETMFGTIMSSAGGLFGTAYLVKYLKLSSDIMRTSLMSRNITAAMALAIANMLNASPSLAVSAVVITGLFGANFGASILDSVGMKDPVARGMGIGAAAHGLGTAAFTEEKDAFPFAAISMALTACASTVLVSIPSVKSALLKIALG